MDMFHQGLLFLALLLSSGCCSFDFRHFPSFAEVEDFLFHVNESSSLAQLSVQGHTVEGRPIYLLRIGDQGHDSIFMDAGIHAREWIAPTTALYVIDKLMAADATDPRRLNMTYFIMPLLNPDGYEFSRTPGNRMWRKNRARNVNKGCMGVDLNRNYDVIGYGVGGSRDPCSDNYMDESAGSQAEVKAASQVLMTHRQKLRVSLSLHSYGQKWLTSWGYTSKHAPDHDKLIHLGLKAAKAMEAVNGREYEVETAAGLYPAGGASDDFAKARAGIEYAVTIELPPDKKSFNDGFQISSASIKSVGEEVWAGLLPVALAAKRIEDSNGSSSSSN